MPVTAKLSRRFYDAFGEEVVNELVEWFNQVDASYRSDLLRLNDFNADRYDAKLKQRFAEFELRIDRRFVAFEARVDQRFIDFEARVDQRFADLEAKFDKRFVELEAKMDRRFAEFEVRFVDLEARIDQRFARVDTQFAAVDRRISELETRLTVGAEKMRADLIKWMFLFWVGSMATMLALFQTLR